MKTVITIVASVRKSGFFLLAFMKVWSDFQKKSSERLKAIVPDKNLEMIVWSSEMTQEKNIHNVAKKDYVVQFWGNGSDTEDPQIKILADNGYKMIFSNFDSWNLDCGWAAYVGEGTNWCSPYKGKKNNV
jgi:hexosaminidase